MPVLSRRLVQRCALAALAALGLASCSTLQYYAQAAHGQLALVSASRPIDDWLADAGTAPKLRQRLEKARQIRRFAVEALALPDNGSYKNYTALGRPYVIWNVVAAPEFSLTPLHWCFPVAGCVSYRGYYDQAAARAYADSLRAEGDDVQVGGVSAYSTLGWFNDPLISTFIDYPDAELARLIFHELAHQVVYVGGDSRFNESFASAVEEAGVQRWLDRFGDPAKRAAYDAYKRRRADFLALLGQTRARLAAIYASGAAPEVMRADKAATFARLQADYQTLKQSWGGYAGYDRWFAEPLGNAHLASIATYSEAVPAFTALLAEAGSFPAFYARVRAIAALAPDARQRALGLAPLGQQP